MNLSKTDALSAENISIIKNKVDSVVFFKNKIAQIQPKPISDLCRQFHHSVTSIPEFVAIHQNEIKEIIDLNRKRNFVRILIQLKSTPQQIYDMISSDDENNVVNSIKLTNLFLSISQKYHSEAPIIEKVLKEMNFIPILEYANYLMNAYEYDIINNNLNAVRTHYKNSLRSALFLAILCKNDIKSENQKTPKQILNSFLGIWLAKIQKFATITCVTPFEDIRKDCVYLNRVIDVLENEKKYLLQNSDIISDDNLKKEISTQFDEIFNKGLRYEAKHRYFCDQGGIIFNKKVTVDLNAASSAKKESGEDLVPTYLMLFVEIYKLIENLKSEPNCLEKHNEHIKTLDAIEKTGFLQRYPQISSELMKFIYLFDIKLETSPENMLYIYIFICSYILPFLCKNDMMMMGIKKYIGKKIKPQVVSAFSSSIVDGLLDKSLDIFAPIQKVIKILDKICLNSDKIEFKKKTIASLKKAVRNCILQFLIDNRALGVSVLNSYSIWKDFNIAFQAYGMLDDDELNRMNDIIGCI